MPVANVYRVVQPGGNRNAAAAVRSQPPPYLHHARSVIWLNLVVGRFLSNHDAMRMTFAVARRADAHKLRL